VAAIKTITNGCKHGWRDLLALRYDETRTTNTLRQKRETWTTPGQWMLQIKCTGVSTLHQFQGPLNARNLAVRPANTADNKQGIRTHAERPFETRSHSSDYTHRYRRHCEISNMQDSSREEPTQVQPLTSNNLKQVITVIRQVQRREYSRGCWITRQNRNCDNYLSNQVVICLSATFTTIQRIFEVQTKDLESSTYTSHEPKCWHDRWYWQLHSN
jgi:hypothetical protein